MPSPPPGSSWTKRSASSRNWTNGAPSCKRAETRCRRSAMRDAERLEQLRQDADRKEKSGRSPRADRTGTLPGQAVRRQGNPNAHRAGTGRTNSPRRYARPRPRPRRGLRPAAPDSVTALDRPNREAAARIPSCQPNGPAASTARSLPTWMPPRLRGRHSRPGQEGRPGHRRPQARAVAQLDRLLADVARTRGSYRLRRKRKAGCRLTSRPRPTESRPQTWR